MSVLSARDGYRRWAPVYPEETAVTLLERHVTEQLSVATHGRRLLDVGCGTGSAWQPSGAALAVGVDLSPEMLARMPARRHVAAADARALPIVGASFDVVWCRLVIGYVAEIDLVYAELARTCRPGGVVLVTDLHEDAVTAGHRRTFRDAAGELHELRQHPHSARDHLVAAGSVGLQGLAAHDGQVGPALRDFYLRAEREAMYEAQLGLRLVWGRSFRRVG